MRLRNLVFTCAALLTGIMTVLVLRPAPAPRAQATAADPAPEDEHAGHDHAAPARAPVVALAPAPAAAPEDSMSMPPEAVIKPEVLQGEKALVLTEEDRRVRRGKSEKLIGATLGWLAEQKAAASPEEARLLAIRIQRLEDRRRSFDGAGQPAPVEPAGVTDRAPAP